MNDHCQISAKYANETSISGQNLARTLYGPTDIFLTGELGAGKTTFLNGLSLALGIEENTKSPTFSLENRYQIEKFGEFIHIDLYRLSPSEANHLIAGTDDHTGIRCIEWADKLQHIPEEGIHVHIGDKTDTRSIEITFYDAALPSTEQIIEWRQEFALPEPIARHCNAVANFAVECANILENKGCCIRKQALHAAGRLHDLFRFLDFQPGGAHNPDADPSVEPDVWQQIRTRYKNQGHEEACANFLVEKRFRIIGEIVRHHGLRIPPGTASTIEQKLVYYADKRMIVDTKVSVQERFEDFMQRYGNGTWSEDGKIWLQQVQTVEQELFGSHPPR